MQKEKLKGCCLFGKRNVMFRLNGRMQTLYVVPIMMKTTSNGKPTDVIDLQLMLKRGFFFWENLIEWIENEKLLWLLFCDLNEIVDNSERLGGKELPRKRLFLMEFLQTTRAFDLSFCGENTHD